MPTIPLEEYLWLAEKVALKCRLPYTTYDERYSDALYGIYMCLIDCNFDPSNDNAVGYLYRCARNEVFDGFRFNQGNPKWVRIAKDIPAPEKQETLDISSILPLLNDKQREIILLRLNGLSYKKIAKKLKMSQSAIRKQISRAYSALNLDMGQHIIIK